MEEVSEPKEELEWSTMKFKEKINFVFGNVTVEPMMACYIIPSVLALLANQNLSLEKACRVNLGYSAEVCDALTARETVNLTTEETKVQQLVAGITVWKTFVQSLIPGLLIIFIGSWSDRKHMRRPFMLIPILGEFLSSLSLIVCTYFFYELPMEVNVFAESIFPALTGGWMTMNMAVFSYIGDVSTVENRTLRIGIVNVCALSASPVGVALSGTLFSLVGFYGVFLITCITYIFSIIFGTLLVKEVKINHISHENSINWCNELEENKSHERVYDCDRRDLNKNSISLNLNTSFLKDFFDTQHVKETVSVLVSGTKKECRMKLLLIIVFIVVIGPWYGEMVVMYLFMRYRFNWNEVQFSMFSTYSIITNLIGTTISVGIFSHMMKIDDALIGIMSCASKILAGFIYAFAQTEWQVYLAALVDIMNGTSYIAMRSIASKLVPPDELGKLNSLYGACESLTPLLYGPMYAFVYAQTMETMPGAFYVMGGALTLPAITIFGWMYSQHRNDQLQSMATSQSRDKVEDNCHELLNVQPMCNTSDIVAS